MEYRKNKTSDTWHWCRHCPDWPTHEFMMSSGLPVKDSFCEFCKTMDEGGACADCPTFSPSVK